MYEQHERVYIIILTLNNQQKLMQYFDINGTMNVRVNQEEGGRVSLVRVGEYLQCNDRVGEYLQYNDKL